MEEIKKLLHLCCGLFLFFGGTAWAQPQDSSLQKWVAAYSQQPTEEHLQACVVGMVQQGKPQEAQKLIERHQRKNKNRSLFYAVDLAYASEAARDEKSQTEALSAIWQGVATQPGMALAYSDRFKSYGRFAWAVDVLERAEAVIPQIRYTYQKVQLWADLGDLTKVYQGYVQLLNENAGFASTIQMYLTNSLDDQGRFPSSDLLYTALLERLQGESSAVHEDFLVWCYIQEGRFSHALLYLRALDKRTQGGARFRIAQLGLAAENQNQGKDALACYTYLTQNGLQAPLAEEAQRGKWRIQGNDPEAWSNLRREVKNPSTPWPHSLRNEAELVLCEVWIRGYQQLDSAKTLLAQILQRTPDEATVHGEAQMLYGDVVMLQRKPFEALLAYASVALSFGGNPMGDEAAFRKARVSYLTGDLVWAKTQFDVLKHSTAKHIANDALEAVDRILEGTTEDSTGTLLKQWARAELLAAQGMQLSAEALTDSLLGQMTESDPLWDNIVLQKARWFVEKKQFSQAGLLFMQLVGKPEKDITRDDALWEWSLLLSGPLLQKTQAKEVWLQLITDHPDSIYTPLARRKLRTEETES